MTDRITPAEWEALSAYLDNELNPRERSWLEQQLKSRQDLRRALDELRQTRMVLRAAPRLRAPRNFTLSPQMAGVRFQQRPVPSAFPILRLASVLATFFFILVTVGSLYIRTYGPEPRVVAVAPQSEPWAEGMGGGPAIQPMQAMEAPQDATTNSAATSYPGLAEAQELQVTVEAMPEAAQPAANAKMPPAEPVPAQDRGLSGWTIGWTILTIVQVLLALLAIGAGLAALYVRRSSQG